MKLGLVAPVVVPGDNGPRVAPDNGKIKDYCHSTMRLGKGFTWALTCLCPVSSSDGHVEASLEWAIKYQERLAT